jgi:hypothetical protein
VTSNESRQRGLRSSRSLTSPSKYGIEFLSGSFSRLQEYLNSRRSSAGRSTSTGRSGSITRSSRTRTSCFDGRLSAGSWCGSRWVADVRQPVPTRLGREHIRGLALRLILIEDANQVELSHSPGWVSVADPNSPCFGQASARALKEISRFSKRTFPICFSGHYSVHSLVHGLTKNQVALCSEYASRTSVLERLP